MTFPRYIPALATQIRSSADTTTSAVKKVRFMKLYKNLTLMVLFGMTLVMLGMASAAYATSIDPGVILRGDGASMPVGLVFAGAFQTPAGAPFACPADGPQNNCFQNDSAFTFSALHLYFNNTSLTYSCGDNSLDPFFLNCLVNGAVNFNGSPTIEVTFSGLGFRETGDSALAYVPPSGCGADGCQGITFFDHFLLGIDTTDMTTYEAVADPLVGSTPEPASALLFVIAMGAIALFLKRT
jgi:hypothetical protein